MGHFSVFVSYSHKDEWLKNELVSHFSALVRNGVIDVWHDRLIPAGGLVSDEIDSAIEKADVILLLISADFIKSNYCYQREYATALERQERGDAVIVPVIVRYCDWDVGKLREFNALPPDGEPVTSNGGSRETGESRDKAWVTVIDGLKNTVRDLKASRTPPSIRAEYVEGLFLVENIRHQAMPNLDERLIFVDPDIYDETNENLITRLDRLLDALVQDRATVISGKDRSGKSLLAKVLQTGLCERGHPAILISGSQIKNADVERVIKASRLKQFESGTYSDSSFGVIIDDFDECGLPDAVKQSIISFINQNYSKTLIFSFTAAPSVLFAAEGAPTPASYNIKPLANTKIMELVRRWRAIGLVGNAEPVDTEVLRTYERLQTVFQQTEIETSPYSAATFLELLDSSSGADIAVSSFAACYESLITNRLNSHGVNWKSFDEAKNFLALVGYTAYQNDGTSFIQREAFESCLDVFESQYFSDRAGLRKMALTAFLREKEDGFQFYEEYLWYFFTARYVVKVLRRTKPTKYEEFLDVCTANVFRKQFANIVIYVSYFLDDNEVLKKLLRTLDGLFSKASGWVLTDETRELMVGKPEQDHLYLFDKNEIAENRNVILRERVGDIIGTAEKVVASYTIPFLNPHIADSEMVTDISTNELDTNSYMKSVNALMRIHSVIGQILSSRSGTYDADMVLDCITRMVKASGRYASLNHAIAAVLFYDREGSAKEVDEAIDSDSMSIDEKFNRVMRLFAFWSVHFSQSGLARYLCQDHSIRALEKLADRYETPDKRTKFTPYNFTSVLLIAKLYQDGRIDRGAISQCLETYGEHSALIGLLRATIHMYSYYMPLTIEDKQWISNKLKMKLQKIEAVQRKAIEHQSKDKVESA